jgi:hypothetical protein
MPRPTSYVLKLPCILILFLSGCLATQMQNKYKNSLNNEISAWKNISKVSEANCPDSLPSKALIEFECTDNLIKTYIAPVAVFPDLLAEFRLKLRANAIDYKKKRIDLDERKLLAGMAFQDYIRNIKSRIDISVNEASVQDDITIQNVNESLKGIGRQNNTTTNCSPNYIGGFTCRTQ